MSIFKDPFIAGLVVGFLAGLVVAGVIAINVRYRRLKLTPEEKAELEKEMQLW